VNKEVKYSLAGGYSLSLSKSINDNWHNARDLPVFLTGAYLKAFEEAQLPGLGFIYGELLLGNNHAGFFYFQLIDLSTVKIGSVIHSEPYGKFMKLVSEKITHSLLGRKRSVKHYLLVNGNMSVSGNYGSFIDSGYTKAFPELYIEILEAVSKYTEDDGEVSVTISKDFQFENDLLQKQLQSAGFIRFVMDPVMILNTQPSWKNFEDYLQSLSSKYRLRTITVMEKMEEYELKELTNNDIAANHDRLNELYHAVVSKSPVRIVQTDISYITHLKKELKNSFRVFAWFKDDMPVAFFTAFNYAGRTEAHHIGIDYHLNRTHSLYQNILYQLIKVTIDNRSELLDYGRTAMEMKSTVGAVPVDYAAYIKISNRVLNHLIKPFMPSSPPSNWVQRDPFRKTDS
jgi:hypothetical protein